MDKISISAALRRASRIRGRIGELSTRATQSACYVQDKAPAFDFQSCVEDRTRLVRELVAIQVAVSRANASSAPLPSGVDVLTAIRMLAELKGEIAFWRGLPVRARKEDVEVEDSIDYDVTLDKNVRRERKTTHVSAVDQAERARRVDELQDRFDALNAEVESHNHRVLVEV